MKAFVFVTLFLPSVLVSLPWIAYAVGRSLTGHEEDYDRVLCASPFYWLWTRFWDGAP